MTRTSFLGLSKVFDSVDHKMLFQKFFYYKVHLYNFLHFLLGEQDSMHF